MNDEINLDSVFFRENYTEDNDNGNMNAFIRGCFYPSCGLPFTVGPETMKQ